MAETLTYAEIETAEQVRETYDILMKSAPDRILHRDSDTDYLTVHAEERIAFMEAAMLAATKIIIGK